MVRADAARGVAGRGPDFCRGDDVVGPCAFADLRATGLRDGAAPRFFDADAFAAVVFGDAARSAGTRRAFGLAGSCIVASIFTSRGVSSRQSPGVSFGSEIGPMATRRSFDTG